MRGRYVTDKEFIETWSRFPTPALVAKELGMGLRSAQYRRNSLEAKLGIKLATMSNQPGTREQDLGALPVTINEVRQFIQMDITDGVIVVGSDAHYSPECVPVAHVGMLAVLSSVPNIRAIILNGDILDGGQASRHSRIGWQPQVTVKQELEAVQDRLTELEKAAPPGCRLLRTIGNHDIRFDSILSANAGTMEGIAGFRLSDHVPLWHEAWRIQINADTIVLHDWHSGIHSGHNDVMKGGGFHVITGHTHELTVKTHRGFGAAHYGVKTGMLADEDQSQFNYRGGKPGMNWTSGFVVLTWKDGVLLYPEVANVIDGTCYFRGQAITEMVET